jgi:hypothetical protein
MTFFISILWAILTFGGPAFGNGSHLPLTDHHVHQVHGGMQVMDTNTGGPT